MPLRGSIHVASLDLYPLDPRIESACQGAHTLALEVAPDPAARLQAAQRMAAAGVSPEGDTLDRHLGRDVLERLERRLNVSGASLDNVRRLRPWCLALLLGQGELPPPGDQAALGIDAYFAWQAGSRKRVVALETIDEHVALVAGMPDTVQVAMLEQVLDGLPDPGDVMRKTRAACTSSSWAAATSWAPMGASTSCAPAATPPSSSRAAHPAAARA